MVVTCENRKVKNMKILRIAMTLALLISVGCSTSGPPKPPIEIPLAVHRAGEVISTDMRIDRARHYELRLYFYYYGKESFQNKDQDRVVALVGRYAKKKDGSYREPGIPVTLEYKITGADIAGNKLEKEKKVISMGSFLHGYKGFNGAVGGFYGREVDEVLLYPGTYHITVKTLEDNDDLTGTPATFVITWDPRFRLMDESIPNQPNQIYY